MEVFFLMKRIMYDPFIKWKAVELKKQGMSQKEIMKVLGVKNRTQIQTWWRWYRNNESYRFEQPLGRPSLNKSNEIELNELDQANRKVRYLEMELDILKKIWGTLRK